MRGEIERRKEEAEELREVISRLNEEIEENKRNNEAEVAMRLKFESKLNHLHALYRDIETRYERACEDIEHLSKQNGDLIKLSDKQRGEISDLTTLRVKLETNVEFHASQIKFHLRESESKQRKINDLEMRSTQLQNVVDQLTKTKSELDSEIKQLKLSLEGKDTNISSLRYERSRLEEALRDMKRQ